MNWHDYFVHNAANRQDLPWHLGVSVPSDLKLSFIRSLQKFQIGESGDGHNLRRQAATAGDANYTAAIDLFIKEEQEHSRLMAGILKAVDAPLIQKDWSDACFVVLRRLFNLHHELFVLLVPEIIAKRYFKALHDGIADPVIRAVCRQILHDEEGHVAFHIDTLQKALGDAGLVRRVLTRTRWRIVFRLGCLVVMLDHGGILGKCGLSRTRFWWDAGLLFDEAASAIFRWSPTPMLTRPAFSTAADAVLEPR